jgi:cell division protein FtsZ
VLINISGGMDLTLFEVDQAASRIRQEVDTEANIIFGSAFDQRIEGRMRVSVVATGIDADERTERPKAVPLNLVRCDRDSNLAHPTGSWLATVQASKATKMAQNHSAEKKPLRAGLPNQVVLKSDESGRSDDLAPLLLNKTIKPPTKGKRGGNGAASGAGLDKSSKSGTRTNGAQATNGSAPNGKGNGDASRTLIAEKSRQPGLASRINKKERSQPGSHGAARVEPVSKAKPEAGDKPKTNGADGLNVPTRAKHEVRSEPRLTRPGVSDCAAPKEHELAGTPPPRLGAPNPEERILGGDKKHKGRLSSDFRRRS